MSDNDFELDLEPAPEPKPKPAPTPASKEPPVLRRTPARKRVKRPTRAAHAAPDPQPGKAARWLAWLVAPRFYYALGFLITAYVIYAQYNPDWGATRQWPHEALGLDGAFAWTPGTARLLASLVLALALLVAACCKAGRGRGTLVIVAACVALAASHEDGRFAALAGLALTGGALLVPRGTPRAAVLVAGLALLAAHLFMPWQEGRFTRGIDLAPSYQANAFDTIDAFAQPKAGVVEAQGWPAMILERLEPSVALLLAGIGLLALVGAGGRWARWAAGALLLLLCLGTLGHLYGEGAAGAAEPLRAGSTAAATAWFGLAAAYVLTLAGGIADVAWGRSTRA